MVKRGRGESHLTAGKKAVSQFTCLKKGFTFIFTFHLHYSKFILKKYKTFSVLIYSYINTSGNWKNDKLCGNSVFSSFFNSTNVDITVYQY